MAMSIPGDIAGRATSGRGAISRTFRRALALREARARQTVRAYLLGLDDATLATFGYDRRALEEAGRGRFPL